MIGRQGFFQLRELLLRKSFSKCGSEVSSESDRTSTGWPFCASATSLHAIKNSSRSVFLLLLFFGFCFVVLLFGPPWIKGEGGNGAGEGEVRVRVTVAVTVTARGRGEGGGVNRIHTRVTWRG